MQEHWRLQHLSAPTAANACAVIEVCGGDEIQLALIAYQWLPVRRMKEQMLIGDKNSDC